MAEELISQYIDLAAIKAQTDFFLAQLNTLKSKYDEVNNLQVNLKGANTAKELVSALNGVNTISKQVIDAQLRLSAATEKYDEIQRDANATTKEKNALSKDVILAQKQYAEAVKTANIEERENLKTAQLREQQSAKNAAAAEKEAAALAKRAAADQPGAAPVPSTDIPFTHNLNEDGTVKQPEITQATTALTELQKVEAEAANSATAMGNSNLQAAEDINKASTEVSGIKGTLDQYTGTLRDNIKAQIENASSINANKAAQKEIQDAIKASGGATTAQVERLAALKEEAILLDKTNKDLSTTIGNQAKEFIASAGSLKEGQAQVNLLQQAYGKLSETERNQPYGLELKKNLDELEPKVKQIEASMGIFSRNVGNYPTVFTGAFTVLEKELDQIKGKLASGALSGKEFDELTKKSNVLASATQTLGGSFKTTASESSAYKEAAKQVGQTFGTSSEVFKNFAKEIGNGNKSLKETDKALAAVEGSGNKAGSVFSKIFSGLRNIANTVPGLGLSGLILLLLTPLTSLASMIYEYSTKATGAAKVTEDLKKNMEEMNKAVHESQNEFVQAVSSVEGLKINIGLAKDGFLSKNEVLKQYNDTLGKTTGEVKNLDEAEAAIVRNGDAYIKMMLYKAAANVALQNAAKKSFEAEEARRKSEADFITLGTKLLYPTTSSAPGFVPGLDAQAKVAENARLAAAKKSKDEAIKEAEDASKTQLDIAQKFQHDAAEIAKNFHFDFFGGTETKKATTKSVKTFTDIIAELRKELATLANEEAIGRITPKDADIDRVKAYDKAFKGLFDLKATASTPIVKKLNIELDPISQRVTEAQLHDLVSKIKPDKAVVEQPVIDNKAQRDLIIKNTSEQIQKITDMEQSGYVHDLEVQKSYLEAGYITEKEYNERVQSLKKEHGHSELDNSIALTEAIIENLKARSDGSKEATDQIADYERKLNDLKARLYEQDVKNDEEANKKKEKNAEKLAKAKADLGKLEIDAAKAAVTLLETLVTASIDNQIRAVQALDAAQQKNYDQQVQRINDSTLTEEQKAERLKIMEAQRQEQKVQNDAKERDLNIKKAKFERLEGAAKIVADTASAEVQALTYLATPITAPLYPGIAALIGAIGAIQLATLLATPLPAYKDGTKSHSGGSFIWGEAGTELAIEPSGKAYYSPDKATLATAPAGTKIIPNYELHTIKNGIDTQNNSVVNNYPPAPLAAKQIIEERKTSVSTNNNVYSRSLIELKIKADIKANDKIVNNDKLTVENRLNALNSSYLDKKTLLNAEYEYYKSVNKDRNVSSEKVELLHNDYHSKLTALTVSHYERVADITLKALETQKLFADTKSHSEVEFFKQVTGLVKANSSSNYVEKTLSLNKSLQEGKVSVETYKTEKERLDSQYHLLMQDRISLLKEVSNKTHETTSINAFVSAIKVIEKTATAITTAISNKQSYNQTSIGATEIASIFFNPLPKFKDGKLTSYEGPAFVGDGNKQEVIMRENGSIEITPDKPVITWIGRNDYVYPDVKNFTSTITKNRTDKIITSTTLGQNELAGLFKEHTRELRNVGRLIKGMPAPRININAKHDPAFQIWVNKNVKGKR